VFINCSLRRFSSEVEKKTQRSFSLMLDKRFYRERKSFLCIDGSKIIPSEQVNDDYCDCEDGSDEPGTSACPRGRFYCTNLGYRPHYIPSSRVNDGICDCCDASDEYNSHAHCPNTCWNLGQRERAYVEGQMRTLDEGLRLKQQLIEEGVLLWREKQAQLGELQQVSEDLQLKLEEHRRKKHEAERLKEQALKALEARDGGEGHFFFNLLYQLKGILNQNIFKIFLKMRALGLLLTLCFGFLSDLQKKLAIDYGANREFLFLNILTPFPPDLFHSKHIFLVWGTWSGTPKNQYGQMVYENGEPCWQGGSRSATVTLTCGTETALRSVKEPSKCQYIMDFQTPVACQPVLKQQGIHSEL
uniref:Glucosidase 2 subunit beta n=1 Tax=Gouania willdenowi TaxID=441366 RepID=A0A8C5GPE7_GOUWI